MYYIYDTCDSKYLKRWVGGLSSTEQLFCAGSFTSILFLDVVKKSFYYPCPLQQLGKYIHPRSKHMFNHDILGFFFFKNYG